VKLAQWIRELKNNWMQQRCGFGEECWTWTNKITNENILKQVNEKRRRNKELRKKPSRLIGHILRKGKLGNEVTTAKQGVERIEEDNGRGCWTVWQSGPAKLVACTRDRKETWPLKSVDKAFLMRNKYANLISSTKQRWMLTLPPSHLNINSATITLEC
jgi:hypothetical protein